MSFLALYAASTYASDISGIGNYQLGDLLNEANIEKISQDQDGTNVYHMQAPRQVELLTLRVNAKKQIYRISGYSPLLSDTGCIQALSELRSQIEKTSPQLGYYALDQGEMFYQGNRIYTLECVNHSGGVRLLRDYLDETLVK
jgi:hypothetical protein